MAFAQQRGDIFDEYSPPAMFGAPLTGLQEVEKEPLAPLTPLTPLPSAASAHEEKIDEAPDAPAPKQQRNPRFQPNIPIISNDDILGRSLVETPPSTNTPSQNAFQPFTPPLPPRRPERFSLSPNMIAKMRGEAESKTAQENSETDATDARVTSASAPRKINENQKVITFHEAQEGNLQIIEMDVRDVLHNIDPHAISATKASAVELPAEEFSSLQFDATNTEFPQGHVVALSYDSDDDVSLSEQHIGKLNSVVLSYLQDAPQNRIEISASSGNADIVQARRNALSRALAVRAYLETKGIEPQKAVIKALGNQTPENAAENLTFITLQ
ncbi:MAG: hypothetical protein ACK4VI_07385 [Alphaproteobacteria bacterium]